MQATATAAAQGDWLPLSTAAIAAVAAVLGALIAALVNAYAANQKIKEIQLQYLNQKRDSYFANARAVIADVYIPLSIALTALSNGYTRLISSTDDGKPLDGNGISAFERECSEYLAIMDSLFSRGADAYLTTTLDEMINDFNEFVTNSVVQKKLVIRSVVQFSAGTWEFGHEYRTNRSRIGAQIISSSISPYLRIYGLNFEYKEKILSAPIGGKEFEYRMKSDIPRLKSLIKEVTLGSAQVK